MQSLVIGFGHKARHGKDTAVATIIQNRKDKYDVRRYSFADPLKREVNEAAFACGGFPQLLEWLRREHNLAPWVTLDENPIMDDPMCPMGKHRTLLQWWGTEYRRSQDPHYWVRKMEQLLNAEKPQIALIADMRFKNEFYWVKSLRENGWTVKVERVGYVADNNNEHPSEKDLDGVEFDVKIWALDGELEDLKRSALEGFDFITKQYGMKSEDADFTVPQGD